MVKFEEKKGKNWKTTQINDEKIGKNWKTTQINYGKMGKKLEANETENKKAKLRD